MYSYAGKSVSSDHLGSSTDLCYIKNCVIMNHVIKRLRCSINLNCFIAINKYVKFHNFDCFLYKY